MDEFIPIDHFNHIIKLWWLVALITLLGGAAGYLFHRLQPPVYEATATLFVTIDDTKMPKLTLPEQYQYDEDIAVEVTKAILISNPVTTALFQQAAAQQIPIDQQAFNTNSAIERQQGLWFVRYRAVDPKTAQAVVNLWTRLAYQEMLARKQAGGIQVYVNFDPPAYAGLPARPAIYRRNDLMLAGCLIGFILGILLSDTLSHRQATATSAWKQAAGQGDF